MTVAVIEDLRPEDRQRLPKAMPKDEKKEASNDKGGDKQAAKGDGKDAKKGAADEDDDPQHAKRIHLQPVKVGRDYGTEVEVVEGLQARATIVANPGDFVAEGALVMAQKRKGDEEKSDKPGGSGTPQGNQSPSMQAPTKGRK